MSPINIDIDIDIVYSAICLWPVSEDPTSIQYIHTIIQCSASGGVEYNTGETSGNISYTYGFKNENR